MKNIIISLIAVILVLVGVILTIVFYILPAKRERIETPSGNEIVVENIVDLSGKKLTQIPESVFIQTNTAELNVSNNQITGSIQSEIGKLQQLKVLNLSHNKMTGVPAEIGQLKNLEVLDLSNNQLTGLPYELGNLPNLVTLNVSGNKYSEADLQKIRENLPATVNIIK